ncbi:hypothetical protein BaRGS_00002515, partial [Batillaria attramentaria]
VIRSLVPEHYVRELVHHQAYFDDVFHLITCCNRIGHWTVCENGRTIETMTTLGKDYLSIHRQKLSSRAYLALNADMKIVFLASIRGVIKQIFQGHQLHNAHRSAPGFSLRCAITMDQGRMIDAGLREFEFKELKLYEPVLQIGFLKDNGTPGFYVQHSCKILFYELDDFYTLFTYLESSIFKVQRLSGLGEHGNRLMIATDILDKYVYNAYRRRLYMVLNHGEVLVLSCKKTPFRALQLYKPHSQDEGMVGDYGAEIEDMAVFMGLQNGQISLLSSDCFAMPKPVQAHHAYISCMEPLAEANDGATRVYRTSNILLSVGAELVIKMWQLCCQPDETAGLKLHFQIMLEIRVFDEPRFLSAANDRICVVLAEKTDSEVTTPVNRDDYYNAGWTVVSGSNVCDEEACTVLMYDISRALHAAEAGEKLAHPYTCLTHTPDYDHTETVIALDKCPLLGIFATASNDRTIKIWSNSNELVRELVLFDPLVDMCFATDFGDLFIAREYTIVYVRCERILVVDVYVPGRVCWVQLMTF